MGTKEGTGEDKGRVLGRRTKNGKVVRWREVERREGKERTEK